MNQEVFRELVSASRTEQADQRQGYDDDFGQRRTQHELRSSEPNADGRALNFMPRQVGKDDARETHSRSGYMDRAEMRRRGLEVPVEASMSAINQTQRHEAALEAHADAEQAGNSDGSISDTDLEAALQVGRAQKQSNAVQDPIEHKPTFLPIIAPDTKPEFIYVNGKRMRKKRKQAPIKIKNQTTDSSFVPESDKLLGDSNSRSNEREKETESGASTGNESQQYKTNSAPSFVSRVEEDADDIFADAGQWQGLSDEEVSQTQKSRQGRSGDWFVSEPNAKEIQAEDGARSTQPSASPPSPPSPRESEDESVPTRLQGLESSALPTEMSRWLLDRNDSQPSHTTSAPARKRKRSKKGRGEPDSP